MAPQPTKLKTVKDISRKDILFAVARAPGSTRLFVGGSDFKVHELDVSQPKPEDRELAAHGSYVTALALADKSLISGGYDGKLIWWDLEKKAITRTLEAHSKWIRGVALSPDGATLASVADDMICRLWDPATGTMKLELKGHPEKTPTHFSSMLYVCAFSANGKHLATADRAGLVLIWDVASGKQVGKVDAAGLYTWDGTQRIRSIGGVRSLAFSPDGKYLAAGGVGKIGNVDSLDGAARVEVFDWAEGKPYHVFASGKGLVTHLSFHPEGDWLLAASGGQHLVQFLDLKTKKMVHQFKAPMFIHAATLNETSDTVYAVGHNKIVVLEMKG